MKYRSISGIGVRASVIGMGCANLASLSNPIPRERALATLHAALDNGINFFDTADSYGQGRSEQLIGEALKGHRQDAIIQTKVGHCFGIAGKSASLLKEVVKTTARYIPGMGKAILRLRNATLTQNFTSDYIRASVEASLVRLHTDYIDILMLHSPPSPLPMQDEVQKVLESLRTEGKILRYGVSTEGINLDQAPLMPREITQFPLVSPAEDVVAYAERLQSDTSFLIGRESFRYCRMECERDAAFRKQMDAVSDDFFDAAMALCLHRFPIGVLLVGMTRPESALRNASLLDRVSVEGLDMATDNDY